MLSAHNWHLLSYLHLLLKTNETISHRFDFEHLIKLLLTYTKLRNNVQYNFTNLLFIHAHAIFSSRTPKKKTICKNYTNLSTTAAV